MRTLRLPLAAAAVLLLIAVSMIPLVEVVGRAKMYFASATSQFHDTEASAKNRFFESDTLRLLRPAVPFVLVLVLLQCGAAYAVSVLLSRSAFLKSRSFVTTFCLSAVLTITATTALWIKIFR